MSIIVGIHGIKTRRKYNWVRIFGLHMKYDPRFEGWIFKNGNYGYLEWIWCILPFVRYGRIRWFIKFLRKIQTLNPGASINIIAHSYGTMVAYEAIRQAGKDGREPIKINNLVLIASVISSHEDFSDTIEIGLIKKIYNYCSYDDNVARFNPFGHSGYWGFLPSKSHDHVLRPWLGVENCRYDVTHSEWFDVDPPDFYKMWLNNIVGKE